jgi:glycerol-3-phosphate acyltransferase PlsY
MVFAFDMAKGAAPVLFFMHRASPDVFTGPNASIYVGIVCGVAAIIGHVRPFYLKFGRGGKGVATAAGVFLALAPVQTALVLVIFAVVLLSSGYVSLGSLTSATMLPVLLGITVGIESPLFVVSLLISALVFWTHRANIRRLRDGEETRFGKAGLPARRPALLLAVGLVIAMAVLIAARYA